MNPIKYVSEDGERELVGCGSCGSLWRPDTFGGRHVAAMAQARATAEACCQAPTCVACGAEARAPYTRCDGCLRDVERQRLARVYERAEKVAVRDWDGAVYDPWSEAFHADVEQMLLDYADAEAPIPPYVHPCHARPPALDLRRVLDEAWERALEGIEDAEPAWAGVEDLARAVKDFNAKQTFRVWDPDMTRVVDLHGVS